MDKLWWMHISRAHKFLEDIVGSAAGGKSIVLSLPEKVPWADTLREVVEERLRMVNPKNSFDVIQCPEEEAGLYLLETYCKKERRESYRYGTTYAAFLGKCEDTVLNDRYIWVRNIPDERYDEWFDFISEYTKNVKGKTPAVFILETHDERFAGRAKKGIVKLMFDKNIGPYDKYAFCALAASETICRDHMRPYLAELAATICKDDVELSAECVGAGNEFLKDPAGTIQNIIREKVRSDGSRYSFQHAEDELSNMIWETQVKMIFPCIERYRSGFIKKHYKAIQAGLPVQNAFDEEVNNPEDVEIGTLVLMAGRGVLQVGNTDYQELVSFKEARNKLAHLGTLSLETVDAILKKE